MKLLETLIQNIETLFQMASRIIQSAEPVVLRALLLTILIIEALRFISSVLGNPALSA